MSRPASPYLAPGFYDDALAKGRHRDIVGGRWEETGRLQIALLRDEGLQPHHRLLDIGAGSLRLGCKAVPYLERGHYWATDASLPLMQRGHQAELADPARLPLAHLIEDADFAFPGIPDSIDYVIAWGVFTHLPGENLGRALTSLRHRFPRLQKFLFTLFLADDTAVHAPIAQPDGVVTHPARPPYHVLTRDVFAQCSSAGFAAFARDNRLPRGQRLWVAWPA
ncbi:MAG: class I SAM-dependent methyltransferase [Pseudomonadota bacterium]